MYLPKLYCLYLDCFYHGPTPSSLPQSSFFTTAPPFLTLALPLSRELEPLLGVFHPVRSRSAHTIWTCRFPDRHVPVACTECPLFSHYRHQQLPASSPGHADVRRLTPYPGDDLCLFNRAGQAALPGVFPNGSIIRSCSFWRSR